jgi:hypothetical protein
VDVEERVWRYACEVAGDGALEAITSVVRFGGDDRHAVPSVARILNGPLRGAWPDVGERLVLLHQRWVRRPALNRDCRTSPVAGAGQPARVGTVAARG